MPSGRRCVPRMRTRRSPMHAAPTASCSTCSMPAATTWKQWEYFKPVGRYNTYFRFIIRNAAGAHVWTIEVNSDSLNQSSWALAYPQQAKEGQRQFQIESAQGDVHVGYRTFSGAAAYDYAKSEVIKIVSAQAGPFPGEAAASSYSIPTRPSMSRASASP